MAALLWSPSSASSHSTQPPERWALLLRNAFVMCKRCNYDTLVGDGPCTEESAIRVFMEMIRSCRGCSFLACTVQGPIDNLVDHINNPTHVTFATNGVSLPFVR